MKLQFSRIDHSGRFVFHLTGTHIISTHWVWYYLGIDTQNLLTSIVIYDYICDKPLIEFPENTYGHAKDVSKYLDKKIRETIAFYTGK